MKSVHLKKDNSASWYRVVSSSVLQFLMWSVFNSGAELGKYCFVVLTRYSEQKGVLQLEGICSFVVSGPPMVCFFFFFKSWKFDYLNKYWWRVLCRQCCRGGGVGCLRSVFPVLGLPLMLTKECGVGGWAAYLGPSSYLRETRFKEARCDILRHLKMSKKILL